LLTFSLAGLARHILEPITRREIANSDVSFTYLYNGPVLLLCVAWLLLRVRDKSELIPLRIFIDALVAAIALSRFLGATIPPSGHALFLSYSLVTIYYKSYRIPAMLMLLLTIALKVSWHDYTSWAYGILVGLGCGVVWIYAGRHTERATQLKTG
jgi:hypothetical protein